MVSSEYPTWPERTPVTPERPRVSAPKPQPAPIDPERGGIVDLYAGRIRVMQANPTMSKRWSPKPECTDPMRSTERQMRRLRISRHTGALVLALFLILSSFASAASAHQQYVVQEGDTLYDVAQRFGIDATQIVRDPSVADLPYLTAGEILLLPDPGETADDILADPDPGPFVSDAYIVQAGDSIELIASAYGVDPDALLAVNGLEWGDYIYPGDRLLIPAGREETIDGILLPAETGGDEAIPGADSAIAFVWVPSLRQQRNLSCEYASTSIATKAFGDGVPEWVFYDSVPSAANPHYGFRGNIDGAWGNYDDYGVYPEALAPVLNEWGFGTDIAYTEGETRFLTEHLLAGHPVVVWLGLWGDTRQVFTDDGTYSVFAGAHVLTAYAYDAEGVYLVDPAFGTYTFLDWASFVWAWSSMDGMGMAVYPL